MSAEPQTPEKTATTQIVEYSETAAALGDLRQRYFNLVADAKTKEGMQVLLKGRAELRSLRTSLEKRREELKAPVLERGKLIDSEAKRITAEITALEEPLDQQIKLEEGRKAREKAEAEERDRQRIADIHRTIAGITTRAGEVVGKKATVIAERLAELEAETASIDETIFGEFVATARDTHERAVVMLKTLHAGAVAQEEAAQKAAEEREREKADLARLRAEEEARMKEAREKAEAEAQARAKQDAEERAEREKKEAAERLAREAEEKKRRAELDRQEEEMAAKRAAAEAEAKRLAEERAALERERRELADGNTVLRDFVRRFGGRGEFGIVVKAINAHLAKVDARSAA